MGDYFLNKANVAVYDYLINHLQTCMMPFFLTNYVDISKKRDTAKYYLETMDPNYAHFIVEKNAEYLSTPSNRIQIQRAVEYLLKCVNTQYQKSLKLEKNNENTKSDIEFETSKQENEKNDILKDNENIHKKVENIENKIENKKLPFSYIADPRIQKNEMHKKYRPMSPISPQTPSSSSPVNINTKYIVKYK